MVRLVEVTDIQAPIDRCFDLARSIELHLLGAESTGEAAVGGVTTGLIGPGEFVRWRARHLGITQHLSSKITAYDRPFHFQDTMVEGIFRFMQHDHIFTALAASLTRMEDDFSFAAPIPLFGQLAERLFLRRYMADFLRSRNTTLKAAAESDQWRSLLPNPVN